MSRESRKHDLEERLTAFAVSVIDAAEALPNTRAGNHVASQLVRCGAWRLGIGSSTPDAPWRLLNPRRGPVRGGPFLKSLTGAIRRP